MANKVFKIPALNGFRWTLETFTPEPNLNTLPHSQQIDYTSYATPIQKTDTEFPALICLSDYPDMLLEFINCDTQAVIATPTLEPTASSLIGQTFLQYLATVNFGAFPTGWCFGRVSFDKNSAVASLSASLKEQLMPFIDGNLILVVDGVETDLLFNGDTYSNASIRAGAPYSFTAQSIDATSSPNPHLRLTVRKNNIVIFDQSIIADEGVTQITYSGIFQPGAVYSASVVTVDNSIVVTPINIPDSTPVVADTESWITCPIDVQEEHPLTMLVKYQNSENDNDVLWTPGNIILQMRIEANMIGGYQPKSVRESFEDQRYDPTLLEGIEYDVYTLYIGGAAIPDWVIRKLNHIFANCDQLKIDYEFYVCTNGTDFRATRPTGTFYRDGMWEIDLQIVPDFEFGQLTAGDEPKGDLVVIRKVWPPLAVQAAIAASFSIVGVFTINSTIDYVQVFNFGLDTFLMKIGTTPGGSEVAELEIGTPDEEGNIALMSVDDIGEPFDESVTIYVTVPDGVNIKCLFVYDQLDAPVLNPVAPIIGAGLPQGTAAFYKELVAGYFTRDWDIVTGLGKVGSEYEGCQILDEAAGKFIQGWNRLNNDITNPSGSRGAPGVTGANQIGAGAGGVPTGNQITIPKAALPNEGLATLSNQVNNTNGDTPTEDSGIARAASDGNPLSYELRKGTLTPTIGISAPMGAGTSMSILNDGLIMLFYVKL